MSQLAFDLWQGLELAEAALVEFRRPKLDGGEIYLHADQAATLDYDPLNRTAIQSKGGNIHAAVRAWSQGICSLVHGVVHDHAALRRLAQEAGNQALAADGQSAPFPAGVASSLPGTQPQDDISLPRARQQAQTLVETLGLPEQGFQAILWKQFFSWSVIVNTEGLHVADWLPSEQVLIRYETSQGAVVDACTSYHLGQPLETGPLKARLTAAVEALAQEGGTPDPVLPLILRPAVAGPLVAGLGWLLHGDTAYRTPRLAQAIGKKLFPAVLSFRDDPRHPDGLNYRTIDDEGRQTLPLLLIDRGRLQTFVHTTETAALMREEPNGHAIRFDTSELPVPWAFNPYIVPRNDPLPEHYNELVARVETLKTMPRAGLVTLVVAGWEIHHGERRRPIGPFDLNLPLLPTFRRLRGVGGDLTFLPTADGCGSPTLIFDALLERREGDDAPASLGLPSSP